MRPEHSGKLNASAEHVLKGSRRATRGYFLLKTGSGYYWKACARMAAYQSPAEWKTTRRDPIKLAEEAMEIGKQRLAGNTARPATSATCFDDG